ncbi:unnamed protein product [Amoebophrya sp. A25]|nr:unnamed protein product [Amoebophrya sp. A25]|eukprot:GSA25T00003591001.1
MAGRILVQELCGRDWLGALAKSRVVRAFAEDDGSGGAHGDSSSGGKLIWSSSSSSIEKINNNRDSTSSASSGTTTRTTSGGTSTSDPRTRRTSIIGGGLGLFKSGPRGNNGNDEHQEQLRGFHGGTKMSAKSSPGGDGRTNMCVLLQDDPDPRMSVLHEAQAVTRESWTTSLLFPFRRRRTEVTSRKEEDDKSGLAKSGLVAKDSGSNGNPQEGFLDEARIEDDEESLPPAVAIGGNINLAFTLARLVRIVATVVRALVEEFVKLVSFLYRFAKNASFETMQFCKRFDTYYSNVYLQHRKRTQTKMCHFVAVSVAAWILVWAILGGNISPWYKAILYAGGIRWLLTWTSILLWEVKPYLRDQIQSANLVFLADIRLFAEICLSYHDVWPHFGDIEEQRDD